MEDISELIRIVNTFTRRNLPLVDLKVGPETENKELRLFLGIKSGAYTNDSEGSEGIYATKEVDFKYRMLKSRLNRKLLNHLFFVDFDPGRDGSKAYRQECMDLLHFSKMLKMLGELEPAQKLLNKSIELSKLYEFNDLALAGMKEMRDLYSETYRPKLFVSLKEEIEQYKQLIDLEEEADKVYYEVKLLLNRSVNNRKKSYDQVEEAIDLLTKQYNQVPSFNIYEKLIKLKTWYYLIAGRFDESLELLASVEKDYQGGKINKDRFDEDFISLNRIKALLKSGRLEDGLEVAAEYKERINPERKHWFQMMDDYFLMAMYAKKYELATDLIVEVFANKTAVFLDQLDKERWELYKSYLFYITGNRRLVKRSSFSEFLNEIPAFDKERAGINVATMILQVLANLDGDLISLHRILHELDEYLVRHLNNAFSRRTKTFCKLLYKIVVHNKDQETILAKSKYLVDKLMEARPQGTELVDIEIIPYEELWDIALQRLNMLKYQAL
jgi:hypothetical protein